MLFLLQEQHPRQAPNQPEAPPSGAAAVQHRFEHTLHPGTGREAPKVYTAILLQVWFALPEAVPAACSTPLNTSSYQQAAMTIMHDWPCMAQHTHPCVQQPSTPCMQQCNSSCSTQHAFPQQLTRPCVC